MRRILPILFLSFLLFSCNNDKEPEVVEVIYPTANFTYSPNDPHGRDVISFKNVSMDADSYYWDFGNNKTSTLKDPSSSYDSPGIWIVKLTAYSKDKNIRDVTTKTITVKPEYQIFQINKITVNKVPQVFDLSFNSISLYAGAYQTENLGTTDIKSLSVPFSIPSKNYPIIKTTLPKTLYLYMHYEHYSYPIAEYSLSISDVDNRKKKLTLNNAGGDSQITLELEWID